MAIISIQTVWWGSDIQLVYALFSWDAYKIVLIHISPILWVDILWSYWQGLISILQVLITTRHCRECCKLKFSFQFLQLICIVFPFCTSSLCAQAVMWCQLMKYSIEKHIRGIVVSSVFWVLLFYKSTQSLCILVKKNWKLLQIAYKLILENFSQHFSLIFGGGTYQENSGGGNMQEWVTSIISWSSYFGHQCSLNNTRYYSVQPSMWKIRNCIFM